MKFFILGDSWAVGEWCWVGGKLEPVPDTGLGYYLQQSGHTVTNVAQGSAGNFGQLRHAYWTLDQHSDYDYLIWFQTEGIRDVQEIIIDDPEEGQRYFADFTPLDLDYVTYQNYAYAQQLYQRYSIPFVVVGGQSPVRNDLLKDFAFARHTIQSWLAELLQLSTLPPENTFFSWPKLERILDHYKIDKAQYVHSHWHELEQSQHIMKLASHSNLFPDNMHPGRHCHKILSDTILNLC